MYLLFFNQICGIIKQLHFCSYCNSERHSTACILLINCSTKMMNEQMFTINIQQNINFMKNKLLFYFVIGTIRLLN